MRSAMPPRKAVAYFRTSSATNVGADKDSETRQRKAVEAYARTNGIDIVETFYDPAVSGADAIDRRPGFAAMLDRLLSTVCAPSWSRPHPVSPAT